MNFPFRSLLALSILLGAGPLMAAEGVWDEIVGKRVVNYQGETLGHIKDSVVDVEHGRYVGMLVSYGGFLGIGAKTKIVPPNALKDDGRGRSLQLDMDKVRFQNAPTFALSKRLGPPQTQEVAAVYRYFGQTPYFTQVMESSPSSDRKREQLGFVQKGSSVLFMRVETLQGKYLGQVVGLRALNRVTGRLGGVVIALPGSYGWRKKVVEPQSLRYDLQKNCLRLNDRLQPFEDRSSFVMGPDGAFSEEAPYGRPQNPQLALVQGNSATDKRITSEIISGIEQTPWLGHDAKRIQVGTVHGKTILRGRVETAESMRKISEIATQAAGAGHVSNLLVVQPRTGREGDRD
jgi:sporulation protein YlmC with PRC-barrel domain